MNNLIITIKGKQISVPVTSEVFDQIQSAAGSTKATVDITLTAGR